MFVGRNFELTRVFICLIEFAVAGLSATSACIFFKTHKGETARGEPILKGGPLAAGTDRHLASRGRQSGIIKGSMLVTLIGGPRF